jgi:hypothetical protein
MADEQTTPADRVAQAARAYLNAEAEDARASNALSREKEPSEHREALAEVAWNAARKRGRARDDLVVAVSSWEALNV